MNFSEWWSLLTKLEQVYWIIAMPSSIIFVFFMVATFIGGDVDTDTDIDGDIDGDADSQDGIPFQFITIKNLVGFFTIFSWTGLACISGGLSVFAVILSSTIAGIVMMLAMAGIFYFMSKLSESGNINLKNAIGSIGEVYLVIKAKRQTFGKVQFKIEGTFKTLDAITDDENDIKTGSIVEITDVLDNDILVVKSSSK